MRDAPILPVPGLDLAFRVSVALGPIREIGVVDGMRRRIVPIIGGIVAGPRLSGRVMPGGADWQGVRPEDGLARVVAHYWLEADDGATISVLNSGLRHAPPGVLADLSAGLPVPPDAYYFRASPVFEAAGERHRWMNETLFVSVGARLPDSVLLDVYAVG